MVDKSTKFLNKLSKKEHEKVRQTIARILTGDFVGINIKPLVGHKHVFRARVGRTRVIFSNDGASIKIIAVANRDEQTYKNL